MNKYNKNKDIIHILLTKGIRLWGIINRRNRQIKKLKDKLQSIKAILKGTELYTDAELIDRILDVI